MVTMWMGPRPAFTSLMMQWLRRQVGMGRWVRCEASGSRYSLPTIFCSSGNHLDSYSSPNEYESKDRKSTRLNSSHMSISYAVFCLKKKKKQNKAQDNA